jgi:hypothetical protein
MDNRTRGRSAAQWFCLIVGATLVVVGLLGFIADAKFDTSAPRGPPIPSPMAPAQTPSSLPGREALPVARRASSSRPTPPVFGTDQASTPPGRCRHPRRRFCSTPMLVRQQTGSGDDDLYPLLSGCPGYLAVLLTRPFADRAAPRPRAAFPLAPADLFPVSLENASRIRPATLSTAPSVFSRRPDLAIPRAPFRYTGPTFKAGSGGPPPPAQRSRMLSGLLSRNASPKPAAPPRASASGRWA